MTMGGIAMLQTQRYDAHEDEINGKQKHAYVFSEVHAEHSDCPSG